MTTQASLPFSFQSTNPNHQLIKRLTYTYIVLWLVEGALRRWVLPGLATPLLVVRDPVVLMTYILVWKQSPPKSNFISIGALLALASWAYAIVGGHGDLLVATYGVRSDFLHIPMMFIIGKFWNSHDLLRFSKAMLYFSIPYTLLLVLQFYSPQSAWVNRGIGGDLEGAGFSGAMGRFRPPGLFTFTTGVTQLYPIFAAIWLYLLSKKALSISLLIATGAAILVAIPVSISRSLFLGVCIVGACGIAGLIKSKSLSSTTIVQLVVSGVIIVALASLTPAFQDATDAFGTRWENSTTNRGGFEEAIVGRLMKDFTSPFQSAPMLGLGTGISTQVGQKLLTGEKSFGYSEGEWGRLLYEGGLLLGTFILLYRLALLLHLFLLSFANPRALPFFGCVAPLLVIGQFGNATSLGAAIIACGLCLAVVNSERDETRNY